MNVRTFYARSMQEAIRSIKQELGPEAVILSSRRVRKWGTVSEYSAVPRWKSQRPSMMKCRSSPSF